MIDKLYNTFLLLLIAGTIAGVTYLVAGDLTRNNDEILTDISDEDSIYVKKYSLFNKKSEIIAYPTPSSYDGKVIGKYQTHRIIRSGKRSPHTVREYYITVEYSNKIEDIKDKDCYEKYNIGDSVEVMESWYPYYNVEILETH